VQWQAMKQPNTKRICFYTSAYVESDRMVQGILRYHDEHGGFVLRDFRYDSENVPEVFQSSVLRPWHDWNPDGIITMIGPDAGLLEWLERDRRPIVDIGSSWVGRLPSVYTCPSSLAKIAVEHFLSLGLEHFAYVGVRCLPGCKMRCDAFARAARAVGRVPLSYELQHNPLSGLEHIECKAAMESGLERLLRDAPKPLAVMTPTDPIGRVVCMACQRLGLEIPQTVAVLGMGDRASARACLPPLSSIQMALEDIGYRAMELLDQVMQGRTRGAPVIEVPATRLVVRQSTCDAHSKEADIQRALQFIHEHACDGISVQNIMGAVRLSRTKFERDFVQTLGCTPSQEIQRIRLERASELLKTTDLPVKRIARMVGYKRHSTFSASFCKQTGLSPVAFRRSMAERAR
jgi:LacI family transcriptional regulator